MTGSVRIRDCSQGVAEDVASYWERKVARIEQLLHPIPPEQRELRFSFGCRDTGYVARAMLTLPTGSLLARTPSPVAEQRAAVDEVVEQLAEEIRRHMEQAHDDALETRRRRRERDFVAAEPHLTAMLAGHDREGFFEVLRPLLRELHSHARRELTIAQLEGYVRPGELEVGDLLDEVVARASDRWNDRPREQPLDRWLVQLLHEVLDERGVHPPDEPGPPPADDDRGSPRVVDEGWAFPDNPYTYWPYTDALTFDDILPAEDVREPWQELAAEEERRMILEELSKLPSEQRRAFMLHALEGWPIKDIAAAQRRPGEQVREDVQAVRRALRERLQNVTA